MPTRNKMPELERSSGTNFLAWQFLPLGWGLPEVWAGGEVVILPEGPEDQRSPHAEYDAHQLGDGERAEQPVVLGAEDLDDEALDARAHEVDTRPASRR